MWFPLQSKGEAKEAERLRIAQAARERQSAEDAAER